MARKKASGRKYLFSNVESFPVAVNFELSAAELHEYLPKGKKFITKRLYWIRDWKGEMKSGQHCHVNQEEELFIILAGSATIVLDDDGKGKRDYKVKTNDTVFIPRMVWHGFKKASKDFYLLALSTTNYDFDRSGYQEDYKEFKNLLKAR